MNRETGYKVFVYGTLRPQEPYHHLLCTSEHLGQVRTTPHYTLVNLGHYPAMTCVGSTSVAGDLFQVNAATLAKLDAYEEYPEEYDRKLVQLTDGSEALAYVFRKNTRDYPTIASGDWQKR